MDSYERGGAVQFVPVDVESITSTVRTHAPKNKRTHATPHTTHDTRNNAQHTQHRTTHDTRHTTHSEPEHEQQVKHFNIVDFSEAQALHLRAREKGKGREQMRLLELSSQKFEKVSTSRLYLSFSFSFLFSPKLRLTRWCEPVQALQSAPNNFVTLYRWGRVCVLQAKLQRGTPGLVCATWATCVCVRARRACSVCVCGVVDIDDVGSCVRYSRSGSRGQAAAGLRTLCALGRRPPALLPRLLRTG